MNQALYAHMNNKRKMKKNMQRISTNILAKIMILLKADTQINAEHHKSLCTII
jgi:hypothetical protein